MDSAIDRVVEYCDRLDPGEVAGLYLYGSAAAGGLQPDSDLDLLLLTRRSLDAVDRRGLTDLLRQRSGRRAILLPGRPVELTSVVLSAVSPWQYPPTADYLYGEWLRDDFAGGNVPQPQVNPDLAILLTTALETSRPLRGPRLDELIPAVPAADLRRAMLDCLPALLGDLIGDERNVLLTLARIIVTLDSGLIVAKDQAARIVAGQLDASHAMLLYLARQGYLGKARDDWSELGEQARVTATELAGQIRLRDPAHLAEPDPLQPG